MSSETEARPRASEYVERALELVRAHARTIGPLGLATGAALAANQIAARHFGVPISRPDLSPGSILHNLVESLIQGAACTAALWIFLKVGGWSRLLCCGLLVALGDVTLDLPGEIFGSVPQPGLASSFLMLAVIVVTAAVLIRLVLWPVSTLVGDASPRQAARLMTGHVWLYVRATLLMFLPLLTLAVLALALHIKPAAAPVWYMVLSGMLAGGVTMVQQALSVVLYRRATAKG